MRFLRLRDVQQQTGLSSSSIYKFSKLHLFPASVAIGGKSIRWRSETIDRWIIQRIRERDSSKTRTEHTTAWNILLTEGETSESELRVLRIKQVVELTGLAQSTVYKYIGTNCFPRPVTLVGASVGWLEAEVQYWLSTVDGNGADGTLNEPEAPPKAA